MTATAPLLCWKAVTGSEVAFSIVLRDSTIEHAGRLEGSLVGRSVRVAGTERAPRAHRLSCCRARAAGLQCLECRRRL